MFAIKFNIIKFNIIHYCQIIIAYSKPAAKMYKNGPRSLGRGHQNGQRSPFFIFL